MRLLLLITFLVLSVSATKGEKYLLSSPDKRLTAEIEINTGLTLKMGRSGETLFTLSGMSLVIAGQSGQLKKLKVNKTTRNSADEEIIPAIREKSRVYRNTYNEVLLALNSGQSVTFRLFNEGLAYRISTSAKDSLTILKENLQVIFQEGDSVRFQASKTFSSAWESPYEFMKLSEVETGKLCNLPILIQKKNGPFVMFTESDLYDFPGLWVKGTAKPELEGVNAPYPMKLQEKGNIYDHGQVTETCNYIAKVLGSRTYPWRLFAISDHEDGLISNNMVYLLASPTLLKDVSWIKPGVVMFNWWGKHNIYGVGFKAGINTETAKYYIDFCAAHGFRYFLFDDGWCPKEDLLHEVPG